MIIIVLFFHHASNVHVPLDKVWFVHSFSFECVQTARWSRPGETLQYSDLVSVANSVSVLDILLHVRYDV